MSDQKNHTTKVVAVAAMSENRAIGKDGGLPWRVKGDYKFWRKMSDGQTVVIGRKTLMSAPKDLIKHTRPIVLTRDESWQMDGVTACHSIQDALDAARQDCINHDSHTIIIGGGGEIYKQALPFTDIIYLNTIHCTVDGANAFFPELDSNVWIKQGKDRFFEKQDGDTAGYTVQKYARL